MNAPQRLSLNLTTRCNYRCAHCLRGRTHEVVDFPLELLPELLEAAWDIGIQTISLTGGEPCLHPRFDEILDRIAARRFRWSLVTNGSHPERYETTIKRHGQRLRSIGVSIDGARAETHDALRMPGSFEKACQAVRQFKALGLRVHVLYLVTADNYREIPDFLPLAVALGVDFVRFAALIPTSPGMEGALTPEQIKAAYQIISEMPSPGDLEVGITSALDIGSRRCCRNLKVHEPAINPYGEYVLCNDTTGRGLVLGSLHEEPFEQLVVKGIRTASWLRQEWEQGVAVGQIPDDLVPCLFCSRDGRIDSPG